MEEKGKIYVANLNKDQKNSAKKKEVVIQQTSDSNGETMEEKTDEEKVETLLQRSERDLYHLSTVFPFDFFPNRIRIDENKVDLIYGVFFLSDHVVTIFLKDIKVVRVTTGVFFATMDFEIEGFNENPPPIKFLPKDKALKARRILMGLAALMNEGVDLSKFEVSELVEKSEQIGIAKDNVENTS